MVAATARIPRWTALVGAALAAATMTAGCPDLPDSGTADTADMGDADAFVPLALDRVVASVGEPDGGERVTIYGEGILEGAKVLFGTTPGTNILVLDSGRINVNVPPHAPGLVDVRVTLPDGQSGTLPDAYLFRGPLELETITPDVGPTTGGIGVTVTGAGFDDATRVFVGDRELERVDVIDGNTLVGTLPARLAGDAGRVDVVATNGFEQRVRGRAFRYAAPLRLDWLHPASGTSAGGTEVTLTGAGFEVDTVAFVDGVAAETIVAGYGAGMTIRTPPGTHGAADILLAHALDQRLVPDAFVYVDPAQTPAGLALSDAWPAVGPHTGGTQVALTVTGIVDAGTLTVTFDDAPATIIDVRATSNLVVVGTPAGKVGAVTVTVSDGIESTSRTDVFAYEEALEASTVEPAFGPAAGGNEVEVRGRGFSSSAIVLFGGEAGEVRETNDIAVTVRPPPGAAGRVDVTIVDTDRTVTIPGGYEYRSGGAAQLLAVTPGEGAQSGGRIVRVHGRGFRKQTATLRFGGELAEDVRVVDDALIVARAPRGEVGAVNVVDTRLGLLAKAYTFFDPAQRYGGTAGGDIPEALNVTVLDIVQNAGVEDAFVILWDDLGTPYQGLTDDRGQVTFSDIGFGPPQMVTASKDNYTTASIVEFDARDATLLLTPLVSSPPGGGGGGGPVTLPDSVLTGKVTGLDKYIVVPPGDCDNKVLGPGMGTLCEPCVSDDQCVGADARCTALGDQGSRCTTACTVDADCPDGFVCQGVAHDAVQCIPNPGRRAAQCSVTQPDVFAAPQGPGSVGVTNDTGLYQLGSRPGEYAVVCIGGYEDYDTQEFVPQLMGVRRHVFALAGDVVAQQDVRLDIPLSRTLRVRLDDAPLDQALTALHTVDVFLDFGADGVFHMPSVGRGLNVNDFELKYFPERFAESLYDGSYTIYARAVADVPDGQQTGEGSFSLHTGIVEIDDDTVVSVRRDGGYDNRSVHFTEDVFDMHGAGPDGILAAGQDGLVLSWGGSFWGLQQTPTDADLRGVWASEDDAWVVGDDGAVLRRAAFTWDPVPMPAALAASSWRGVHGVGERVWLWGDDGVWSHDGASVTQVILDVPAENVRDVWSDAPDGAWIVGVGGMLLRWVAGATTSFGDGGSDLLAVHGLAGDDIWAVGDDGRIAHWNGSVWFDYLPVTTRTLRAVHAVATDEAWAVGDAGVILRWDGVRWSVHAEVPHADLRGVWTPAGAEPQAAGMHTLIIGPFLRLPRPLNPTVTGVLRGLNLSWGLSPGPRDSFTYLQLLHESGFPYWNIMLNGGRTTAPLPDLEAAWGLQPIWPGNGFVRMYRVYVPGFDIDAYDTTILSQYEWQSWAVTGWPLNVPEPDR